MKFFGLAIIAVAFFSIMVDGTYSRSEVVEVTLQLVPSPMAQPDLVERSLGEYNGVQSVVLDRASSRLSVRYDKARITLTDLEHLLTTLGYRALELQTVQAAQASL